jgi:hypothetical protein
VCSATASTRAEQSIPSTESGRPLPSKGCAEVSTTPTQKSAALAAIPRSSPFGIYLFAIVAGVNLRQARRWVAGIFSDVLLDHSMPSTGARYRDLSSEDGRSKWARVAAQGVYELLFEDRGARKGPDVRAVEEASAALSRARAKEAEIEEQRRMRRESARRNAETLDVNQLLVIMLEVDAAADDLKDATRAVDMAEAKLAAARAIEVAVPCDIDDDDIPRLPDHVDPPARPGEEEMPVLRTWATADEFRWCLGNHIVSAATVRRWMSGHLRTRPATVATCSIRLLRRASSRAAVFQRSPRDRRIMLDRLDWSRFTAAVQERFEVIRRSPPPLQPPATEPNEP